MLAGENSPFAWQTSAGIVLCSSQRRGPHPVYTIRRKSFLLHDLETTYASIDYSEWNSLHSNLSSSHLNSPHQSTNLWQERRARAEDLSGKHWSSDSRELSEQCRIGIPENEASNVEFSQEYESGWAIPTRKAGDSGEVREPVGESRMRHSSPYR